MNTYFICGAPVRGIPLPKLPGEPINISSDNPVEFETRPPAQGTVTENPQSGRGGRCQRVVHIVRFSRLM